MRTKKTDKPAAEPLATKVRAALAQDWHTLDALEALAGRAPAARHRVHAALAELRAGGCALEERVTRGVAEVRLGPATLPAPVPDDHRADLAATVTDLAREAAEMGVEDGHEWAEALDSLGLSEEEAERMRPVWTSAQDAWRRERVEGEQASVAPSEPAPAPPCEPSAPVGVADALSEAPREPTDPLFVECRVCNADPGHPCKGVEGQEFDGSPHVMRAADAEAWASEQEGKPSATPFDHPPAPRSPGPSSRCAVCGEQYRHHATNSTPNPHPFLAKPRGRPRVAAAPPSPPLDAPPVEAPCVDCGEERGTCPEGRCRDCDIEHGTSLGACRECHTWIIREDVGGPAHDQHVAGCTLASTPNCTPRNVPEYVAVRGARCGWKPPPGWTMTGWAHWYRAPVCGDAEPETSRGGSDGFTPDTLDAIREVVETAPPSVRERVRARRKAPPLNLDTRGPVTDEQRAAVARVEAIVRAEMGRCRPPLCHADDIHVPSAVRGFARPLCERHRAWVEGAGGTLAAGGLAGVLP